MANRDRKWMWYWGGWALLALYMASWDISMDKRPDVVRLLAMNLLQNLVWGLLGLVLVWLADHHPIESFSLREWRIWGLQLGTTIAVAALGLFLAYLIYRGFYAEVLKKVSPTMGYFSGLPYFYRNYFHLNLLFMWALLGALHGHLIYRKFRAREVEAARLEARFAEAQNLALRMQLQPHFLFNTLNSVSALIHTSPEGADRMIGRLGDFLRMTLDASPEQMVPLRKELAFIEAYLAIERVRFQERLQVRVEVPLELLTARVPSFILQPLVENALKHGLSDRSQGGTLIVRAQRDSEYLVLEVQDDGEGFVAGREGVGLSNVRARLGLLYRGQHRIDILGASGKGTLVTLRLPMDVPSPEVIP
ncbi:MAG: histidine kinase [Holophaga sp.]|nr:histidine kinase [Holophaga sp.]